jgi:hypothetical protein
VPAQCRPQMNAPFKLQSKLCCSSAELVSFLGISVMMGQRVVYCSSSWLPQPVD